MLCLYVLKLKSPSPFSPSEYCLWFMKLVYVIRKMKFVSIIRKCTLSCEQLHAHWTLSSLSSLIMDSGFGYFRLTVPPLSSHGKDWLGPGAQTWKGRTEAQASCGHAKQRLRHAPWLEIKPQLAAAERSLKGRSRQKVLTQAARIQHWGEAHI